jgi:serine/threonine protein kinase
MVQAYPQPAKSTEPIQDLSGTTVGRFAIRVHLGAGGMGEVYRAEDTKLRRSVALKRMAPQLRADEGYRRRFLKEAERASRLNDPHIASVYDVLEEKGETFLVMEYVEGQTLRQRLGEGPLSLREFLPLAIQCSQALAAAHGKGIVHRDIKPENVMVTPGGQVKILDFGVAKHLPRRDDSSTTLSTESTIDGFSGTVAYAAPELLLEKGVDARADIFSLGLIFYEAFAGRHPFLGETYVATADRIIHETGVPITQINPRLPSGLETIVNRMLAKDPGERHATAADVVADLRALERSLARPAPTPKLRRHGLALRARWAAVGAAVLALTLLALVIPSVRQTLGRWLGLGVDIPAEKHLVVLPFANVGADPADQVFCDGLTYTLTSELTQLVQPQGSLQVVPASEVVSRDVDSVEEARKQFGVSLVLTGSVQRTSSPTPSLIPTLAQRSFSKGATQRRRAPSRRRPNCCPATISTGATWATPTVSLPVRGRRRQVPTSLPSRWRKKNCKSTLTTHWSMPTWRDTTPAAAGHRRP